MEKLAGCILTICTLYVNTSTKKKQLLKIFYKMSYFYFSGAVWSCNILSLLTLKISGENHLLFSYIFQLDKI